MNLGRPLQSPDSLLCQLPALITCSWVPGFGVYIRYLTLPLLPLTVYNRQTWDILKTAHASFPKPSSLFTVRFQKSRNPRSHKHSLKLDSIKLYNSDWTTHAQRILLWWCWLFASFSKQNHRRINTLYPCIYSFTLQSSWGSLNDCTCSYMCSAWAAFPVNRLPTAQTENMHSPLRAVVLNHWLACSKCFHSTYDVFRDRKNVLFCCMFVFS